MFGGASHAVLPWSAAPRPHEASRTFQNLLEISGTFLFLFWSKAANLRERKVRTPKKVGGQHPALTTSQTKYVGLSVPLVLHLSKTGLDLYSSKYGVVSWAYSVLINILLNTVLEMCRLFGEICCLYFSASLSYSEDEGINFGRNFGTYLQNKTAVQLRREQYSTVSSCQRFFR